MRIDAHQHFWRYNKEEYSWIDENMNTLKNDYLPVHLEKELENLNFEGSIAVQARQNLEETEWLLELATTNNFIKGVVGWVDLCSNKAEEQIARLSENKKLVGVRHVIHDEPDDNFIERKDFQNGLNLLKKYDLTYDLLIFPKHLQLANKLVKKFPDQKFVLDHISKPFIKTQVKEPWSRDIKELSKNKNVYCKLSGMVTEADWQNWKQEHFIYYINTAFDCFGEDRIMIGSDWPVCTVTGSYKQVMDIVINYFKNFNIRILNKILGDNCKMFYLSR